jgi:hypothetical protein
MHLIHGFLAQPARLKLTVHSSLGLTAGMNQKHIPT